MPLEIFKICEMRILELCPKCSQKLSGGCYGAVLFHTGLPDALTSSSEVRSTEGIY